MRYLDAIGLAYLIEQLKSGFDIVKREYTYTTPSAMVVSFTVPNLSDGEDLEVFINGLKAIPTIDYNLSSNVVTLTKELDAGQVVHFIVRSLAGFKMTKREYTYTTSERMIVTFTVPQYTHTDGQDLEVFINGLLAIPTIDYNVTDNVVTLTKELDAGQTVYFAVRGMTS